MVSALRLSDCRIPSGILDMSWFEIEVLKYHGASHGLCLSYDTCDHGATKLRPIVQNFSLKQLMLQVPLSDVVRKTV